MVDIYPVEERCFGLYDDSLGEDVVRELKDLFTSKGLVYITDYIPDSPSIMVGKKDDGGALGITVDIMNENTGRMELVVECLPDLKRIFGVDEDNPVEVSVICGPDDPGMLALLPLPLEVENLNFDIVTCWCGEKLGPEEIHRHLVPDAKKAE